jgi:inhibitor of KinA sporulation pathway (predicted exonuclease)
MGAELSDEFAALVRSFREHAPATSAPELVWTLPPEWGEADLEARYWREAHASGIFELEMVSSHTEFRRRIQWPGRSGG